jgi:hypothetical protein
LQIVHNLIVDNRQSAYQSTAMQKISIFLSLIDNLIVAA